MAGWVMASSGGGFGGKKRGKGKDVPQFGKKKLRVSGETWSLDFEALEKQSDRVALELKLREAEVLGGLMADTTASGEQLASTTRSREEVMKEMQALSEMKVKAFLSAVLQGDVGMVKTLIEKGIDVNARRGDGLTACRLACQEGLTEVLKELIKAEGFDVDETWAADGSSPLLLVCEKGFCEAAKVLLRAGADSNKRGEGWGGDPGEVPEEMEFLRGTTPMMMACQNGHVEVKSQPPSPTP